MTSKGKGEKKKLHPEDRKIKEIKRKGGKDVTVG